MATIVTAAAYVAPTTTTRRPTFAGQKTLTLHLIFYSICSHNHLHDGLFLVLFYVSQKKEFRSAIILYTP